MDKNSLWYHSNKEWQETLDLARLYGWPEPREARDHGGLILQCPAGDARHRIRVYSTGRGTENVARGFRKKIRNCQHGPVAEATLGRIVQALDSAERWISAAEAQLSLADAEHDLDLLVEAIGASEELLAEAEEAFDRLDRQSSELDEELEALLGSPRPDPSDLSDRAAGDLRDAELDLRDAPRDAPQTQSLRDRYKFLAGRLADVQARITG